ncbi:MAG: DMT family transporter [Pseudomonadota bacterium]
MTESQLAIPPIPFWGEIASALTAMFWAISVLLFSRYGRNIPAVTLNLYKNSLAFVFLIIVAFILQPPITWTWLDLFILGLSGVIGISLGDTAFFEALNRLGAQITASSQSIGPPLTAFIAFLVLDETLLPQEWLGMMLTVIGVFLVLRFSHQQEKNIDQTLNQRTFRIGLVMALIASLCQAIAIIVIRSTMQDIDVVTGTLTRLAPAILVLYASALLRRGTLHFGDVVVGSRAFIMVTIAAFVGTFLCLLLMSSGAKYAKAGVSTAIMSTYPVWVIVLSFVIYRERTRTPVIGATLLAITGIAVMVL